MSSTYERTRIHPLAVSLMPAEVLGVENYVVRTGLPGLPGLLFGGNGADHPGSASGGYLTKQQAHPACGRMHQAYVSGGERECRASQVMGGDPLQHDRGTETGAHAIRQLDQPFCRRQRKFGIGTGKALRGYPVPHPHRANTGADLGDRAAGLGARMNGKGTL